MSAAKSHLLLLLLAVAATASGQTWQELGPAPINFQDTGRAAAVAVSSQLVNRYWIGGASGGVWRSTNAGGNWLPTTADLPTQAIGALAVDPTDDRILYAGTGEANIAYHSLYGLGLYKSTNRGRSWRVLAPETFSGRAFARLVVSPHRPSEVWAAVGRAGGSDVALEGARQHPEAEGTLGIFRSLDGGRTWTHLRAPEGLRAIPASDVDLDPVDRRRIYVSLGDPFGSPRNGVYRSTDRGESFVPVTADLGVGPIGRVTLAVAPSNPSRLWALFTNPTQRGLSGGFAPGGSSTLGIHRSDDGGDTWTAIDPGNFQGGQGAYNSAVAVAPDDPDVAFFGGVQMLRTTDAGQSFTDVTPLHVDVHDLAFDAEGRLLAATDGGLFRSADRGQTWTALNQGLGMVQLYPGISVHPTDPEVFVGGAQDNGTNLRIEGGDDWLRILGGDGGNTAIHPNDPSIVFAQYQGASNLFRSTDGGATFNAAATGIAATDRSCFLPPFVIDPSNPDRMLYATQRVYASTDAGLTWTAISDDLTAGPPAAIRSLAIAPADSSVVLAATNDGRVLVSADGGAAWTLALTGIGGWPRVTRQLATDPLNARKLYVADMRFGGRGLLFSNDGGGTWESISAGLPDRPVNTVAVHRPEGGRRRIFVGTDEGVFVSADSGGSWDRYGSGLPRVPVMEVVVDLAHGRLVAATLGRGMWTAPL